MARDMMLTMDEYLAIRRLIDSERESEGAVSVANSTPPKKKRRVSRYQREFGKQYRMLDEKARLRNGSYRSGMNRSKVMNKAHKLTRKALGMK